MISVAAQMVIQGIVLAGIFLTALYALLQKDLLASALMLAAMSLLMSLEFYLLQAPDVAIAEAAVGAGVSTLVLVLGIRKTGRWEE
ncbi:MAG: hypothetical protein DRN14_02015 [Thermoplasmata archaeon]|nr:MAG: hypothetical protein DRN14_02015 [Thermoplasmata archaeon]HDJ27079.1 DUF4040 domain-containing protein [Aciduliprofundum sp.]